MRTFAFIIFIILSARATGQRSCSSFEYLQASKKDPVVASRMAAIEQALSMPAALPLSISGRTAAEVKVIRIPVVIHIVYQNATQNISEEQVLSQLDALNRDFRRKNADTANTPEGFKSLGADAAIEFVLATADPQGRPTTGIVRKATTVAGWEMNDKIKHAATGGSDAWDSQGYLNIWVGKLNKILGYASFPGGKPEDDGIVIAYDAFGTINTKQPYHLGRTLVHEAGHWLGLKHIWGDSYCGDDGVDDTPKQGGFTVGCPTGFRTSCNNGALGDMFMNYMDFTNDACTNIFTRGQANRMRSLFNADGFRNRILFSRGLEQPWMPAAEEIILPVIEKVALYPNPASGAIFLNFEINRNWIGKELVITNAQGIPVQKVIITNTLQKVPIAHLAAGIYFLQGQMEHKKIIEKFIRL